MDPKSVVCQTRGTRKTRWVLLSELRERSRQTVKDAELPSWQRMLEKAKAVL